MSSEETPKPVTSETAGQQLKAAREKLGLSTSQVADAQHLRPSVIQAIENSDFAQIDSELFLKGYVRAYAGQVGLDANRLIARLDEELEPLRQEREQAREESPLATIERKKRKKRQVARLVFLVIVVGAIALGVLRYLEPGIPVPGDRNAVEEPAPEPGDQEPFIADPEPMDREPVDDLPGTADPEAVDPGTVEEVPEPALTREPVQEEGVADAPGPEGRTTEPGADEPPVAAQGAADVPVLTQEPEPVFAEEVPAQANVERARLVATFLDDCWVQVTDANGERLVSSLLRPGGTVDVTGVPPLRVVIGAVDAVESLRFEGEPVNLRDYRVVNNRTEFTLDI